ncbi:hypothetical protein [Rhodobacteraceae bacterium W635]|uniref:hypothetical protein n=1 Tax=Nioella halotolerans TaxID=2303578 RepID=UPI0011C182D9
MRAKGGGFATKQQGVLPRSDKSQGPRAGGIAALCDKSAAFARDGLYLKTTGDGRKTRQSCAPIAVSLCLASPAAALKYNDSGEPARTQ